MKRCRACKYFERSWTILNRNKDKGLCKLKCKEVEKFLEKKHGSDIDSVSLHITKIKFGTVNSCDECDLKKLKGLLK